MEFFIKKNATLPLLKLQVVKDGRSDYNNFMELLETSTIFFSMVNSETGIPKITSRPGGFVEKIFDDPNAEPEYYIYYQFTKQDTSIEGRYEGQFLIKTFEGNVILPIREKLFIYVQESFIADDLEYNTCYTSTFPCCGNPDIVENPNENTITIVPQYYPGSIGALYTATSRYPVDTDITVTFKNVLGVTTGDPIIIDSSVSIFTGSKEGITELIIDEDFDRLNLYTLFSDVILTDNGPSQYDNVPVIGGPIEIDPIKPRPFPKYISAYVTSCCDDTERCMVKIPSFIDIVVGNSLLGSDGICYTIQKLNIVCDMDMDNIVSYGQSYYENCKFCLSKYPCEVIKETPTPTTTSTQNPCLVTPTPTPTTKKDCVRPELNTVLISSGNTFLLYFTVTGPCTTMLVNWSSDNITFNSESGSCSSPRSITIPGSLPPTIYFNISQFNNECPTFTSNTLTYIVIPVTPTNTPTPTQTPTNTPTKTPTPTPTGTLLPPVVVSFIDCCDNSNIFNIYNAPSLPFGSYYEGTYYVQSSGFNGCASVITSPKRPTFAYSYDGLIKQKDCVGCFNNTETFCPTPTPTITRTTTPTVTHTPTPTVTPTVTPLVCDINFEVILVSPTPTPTQTPTNTTTPTQTPTNTITPTLTVTPTPTKPSLPCFGYLYNFYAITGTTTQSLTSNDDWVVPTKANFDTLVSSVGNNGDSLKLVDVTTYWDSNNINATNTSGFSAIGNGGRSNFFFTAQKSSSVYRSITPYNSGGSYVMSLNSSLSTVTVDGAPSHLNGYAIRLVKNTTVLNPGQTGTYIGNDGKTYNTICIGTQEWMSQDLRETSYRNLSSIPNIANQTIWNVLNSGAYCIYDNNPYNVSGCQITPTPTKTSTQTPTNTPTNTPTPTKTPTIYCIEVVGESGCGYIYPTQGVGLMGGKKYWTGTTATGNPFMIYWDTAQYCWVVKNTNTNELCSRLYINSEYPIGNYTEWVSVGNVTQGCVCLSDDTYFGTRLITCNIPSQTPTPTPTPTKTQPSYPDNCIALFNKILPGNTTDYLYSYDINTNVTTLLNTDFLPFTGFSADIAQTTTKLWTYSSWGLTNQTRIYEYNITLNPWSRTYYRTIIANVQFGNGLCAIDDTHLISSIQTNSSPIIKITLNPDNTSTVETLFTLPTGRGIMGDMVYTTNGKIILLSVKTIGTLSHYISQYALINNVWVLEFDKDITSSNLGGVSVVMNNGNIYIVGSPNIYKIGTTFPYAITLVNNTGNIGIGGTSQVPSCYNVTFTTGA
jgi:uncharacterized protein (TIGR02145 family)